MREVVKKNRALINEITQSWMVSEQKRVEFQKSRNEVTEKIDTLFTKIVEQITEEKGPDCKVKPEPIVEENKLIGVKIWIGDQCQFINLKGI